MRSNMWRVVMAVGAIACGSASTRADDLKFSDTSVQPVSYEQEVKSNVPYEVNAIRAAFLSDEPAVVGREPAPFGPVRKAIATSDDSIGRQVKPAANYDVVPESVVADSSCGIGGDGCATCANGAGACAKGGPCNCDVCQLNETCEGPGSVYYAEVQILWLRAHLMEDSVGKLSEKYEWSPRLVAGYENAHGIGGRGRWWHYSHSTPILGEDDIRFGFDVIDVEATARFAMKKADVVVSGGTRWANIDVDFDDESISTGAPGLTAAADLRVELCRKCNAQWAAIGGARFSTLGGDWDGDGGFISAVRDDNITVQELYIGAEYNYLTKGGYNVFTRLTYEIQNWHSDAFSQGAGADSVGFVGPGIHAGASF